MRYGMRDARSCDDSAGPEPANGSRIHEQQTAVFRCLASKQHVVAPSQAAQSPGTRRSVLPAPCCTCSVLDLQPSARCCFPYVRDNGPNPPGRTTIPRPR